jgi:hypothetical protein
VVQFWRTAYPPKWSANSHPFVKHVGSLPSPQQLPVAHYTKPDKYNPNLLLLYLENPFSSYRPMIKSLRPSSLDLSH